MIKFAHSLKYNLLLLLQLIICSGIAQQKNIALYHPLQQGKELELLDADSLSTHTGFRPFIESSFSKKNVQKETGNFFYRKFFKENLIIINDSSNVSRITIDPLFNLELGKDIKDKQGLLYTNTRGVLIRGDIGKNFSFESSFYENQSSLPNYLTAFADSFLVIPGQGRWKKFKSNGFDYSMASGYLSYSTPKHFNFQLGHGKHFIGDGYRSLLLSDNAFNYPYVRITSSFGKFQYTNLYAVFMNLNDGGVKTPANLERLFQKKPAAFQYLSWMPIKPLQIGLFQGMIWNVTDNKNNSDIDFSYFNPLIYVNAFQYGLQNSKNIVLGSNIRIQPLKHVIVYGQYIVDDFADNGSGSLSNKQGYQLGCKFFNLLTVNNLYLQLEYNSVRPYTYAYRDVDQNYAHYNQALAHPLGANFSELNVIFNYRYKAIGFQYKLNHAQTGSDSINKHYGNNIFISDYQSAYGINSTSNEMKQGISTTILNQNFEVSYLVNRVSNFKVLAGLSLRTYSNELLKLNTTYLFIGLRTALSNLYYDF